mmetsp:Transcript_13894/g.39183  ORF Transcript_13894/g.39183 Transcript_13894/m.39183 type:complete len:379 (+) Transcript_13894:1688-2824(+)
MVVPVVKRRESKKRVNLPGLQYPFVICEKHRDPHCPIQVTVIKVLVSEVPIVQSLGPLPRVSIRVVHPDVHGQQAIQDLPGPPHRTRSRRVTQSRALHGIQLQGTQNIKLLRLSGVRHLLGLCLCDLQQQSRRLVVLAGLPEQLDRLGVLVALDLLVRVLDQQLLDVLNVVVFSQPDSVLPLVESNATIDGKIDVRRLHKRLDGIVADSNAHQLGPNRLQEVVAFRQRVNQLRERRVILQGVQALDQLLGVLGLSVVLHSLREHLPIAVVVPHLIPRLDQHLIISSAVLQQFLNLEPVPKLHSQVDGKVRPLALQVDALCLVELLEKDANLRLLQLLVVQGLQLLHELDAVKIGALDEGFVCHDKVQVLQRVLGQQLP